MNERNAMINARQLLIISKLSSRRLIEILSNPTDDKRWKVVTILIGSCSYIFSTFVQLSNNLVTLGIFKVIYIHNVFIKTSGHNDICTHPCNTTYTSFDASPPMYRCVVETKTLLSLGQMTVL